jgi:hypothetical protein
MSAEDLINSANNKVADYAGNASAAANAAVARALSIAVSDVLLPSVYPLNFTAGTPGTVSTGIAPSMTSVTYETPGQVGIAPDILSIMEAAYDSANAESKAAVDAAIYAFLNAYCPGYAANLSALQTALLAGINDVPITAAQQAQIVTQLQNQLDDDRKAAQRKVLSGSANGHETPLFQVARLDAIDNSFTDNLAQARATVAVTLINLTVDMRKFSMGTLNEVINSTRSFVLQYAGIVTQLLDFNTRYAMAAGESAGRGYEAELKQNESLREWALAKLEANLKRMMADLDRYKTDLEAKIKAKELEYAGCEVEIKRKQIGFTGELQTLIQESNLNFRAAELGVDTYNRMAAMWGSIGESAASGVNAIASQSIQE